MKKYAVLVREVWIQIYQTEAESPEEALKQVESGEVDPEDGRIEYSHRLPSTTWTVEEDGEVKQSLDLIWDKLL